MLPSLKLSPPWDPGVVNDLLDDPSTGCLALWIYTRCADQSSGLTESTIERLRRAHLAAVREEVLQEPELLRILKALQSASIRTVVLKGLPLGRRLYGAVGIRPSSDFDLWVDAGDHAAACAVAEKLGYRKLGQTSRDHHFAGLCELGITRVLELHHTLGYLPSRAQDWQSQAWTRAVSETVAGFSYLVLERTDEIIFLCLELVKDLFKNPKRALDLHLCFENWGDTDWTLLISRARTAGLERSVLAASLFCARQHGTRLPPQVATPMPRRSLRTCENWFWSGRLGAGVEAVRLPEVVAIFILLLLLGDSWRDRMYQAAFAARVASQRVRSLWRRTPR